MSSSISGHSPIIYLVLVKLEFSAIDKKTKEWNIRKRYQIFDLRNVFSKF